MAELTMLHPQVSNPPRTALFGLGHGQTQSACTHRVTGDTSPSNLNLTPIPGPRNRPRSPPHWHWRSRFQSSFRNTWGPNFSGDPTRLGPFFRADPDWALFFWVPHRAKIARLVPFFRGSNFGHSPTRAFACTSHRHVRLNVQMNATVMTMF